MPIGKDKKVISVVFKTEVAEEISARAESMHLSDSAYIRLVLTEHMESGRKLTLEEE